MITRKKKTLKLTKESTISYETGVASSTKWFLNDYCVFRYRGYYYDTETGFYYLQSRYYNPTWGRFINADNYINANGDLIGFNMFAYCSNNPVMYADITGHSMEWLGAVGRFLGGFIIAATGIAAMITTLSSLSGNGTLLTEELAVTMYGVFMMASSWDSSIKSDMDAINWNPFNSDPDKQEVNKVSFYKGQPIIVFNSNDISSFSFGVMALNSNDKADINTVKHEWGHYAQLAFQGPAAFTKFVAIPSLSYNIYCKITGDWTNYYKMPWEAYADYLGGVKDR